MSEIDDLIANLCPDGVPVEQLGDLGEFVRGRRITKGDFVESGVGCIHYGEIYTRYGTTATKTFSFVRPELAARLRTARTGDLIIAATGENAEEVCKAVAWLGDEEIAIHDDCYMYRSTFDPTYISYVFQSSLFYDQKIRFAAGAKMVRVSGEALAKIRVPVPPLRVQRAVALILSEMESLEEELRAELEARWRQYDYYRSFLLADWDRDEVEWVALGEIGRWYGGGTPSKSVPEFWQDGSIPWLSPKDMVADTIRVTEDRVTDHALQGSAIKLVPPGSIAFVVRSNILRRRLPVALVPVAVTLNQDMRALVPHPGILVRYVAHVCRAQAEHILRSAGRTDGSMAAIQSAQLLSYRIPVPPLESQERIAATLDKFDALVNDPSIGLPAEIRARRQQYAYYRDRLLAFDRAIA